MGKLLPAITTVYVSYISLVLKSLSLEELQPEKVRATVHTIVLQSAVRLPNATIPVTHGFKQIMGIQDKVQTKIQIQVLTRCQTKANQTNLVKSQTRYLTGIQMKEAVQTRNPTTRKVLTQTKGLAAAAEVAVEAAVEAVRAIRLQKKPKHYSEIATLYAQWYVHWHSTR